MADSSTLGTLLSLISSMSSGTTTTSGSTTTKQTALSQDTLDGLLKSALESSSGLASVVSGQNTAGLYNSTVNTQLTNDLLSRLTTQVAAQNAVTTTTSTPQTTTTAAKVSPTTAAAGALGLAGLSAFKNPIDNWVKKLTANDAEDVTSDAADSGSAITAGISDFNSVDTNTLEGITLASGESTLDSTSALSDAASGISDSFDSASSWLSENYQAATDAMSSADSLGDIGTEVSDSGGVWDTIKDWFS